MTRAALRQPAAICAALLLALHAARAALDAQAQLEIVRAAAFVPARLLALVAPDWAMGRLAAAPPEAARIAAFWLGDGVAPWSVLTYALTHAGWAHALGNALLLAALGAPAARALPARRFVALLAIGAAAGAAAQTSALDAAFAPLVGASACVCAAIGAAARLWTAPGGRFGPVAADGRDTLGAALRRPQARAALAAGLAALLATSLIGDDAAAIGWRAHLGGFVAGFVCVCALAGRRKTEPAQACRSPRTDASSDSGHKRAHDAGSRAARGRSTMTVSVILARKGDAVATAAPDATLHAVARTLAEKKIGAIVVTNADGSIAGIFSERDVVRAVAAKGAAALDEPVVHHMTAKVITTSPDKTIMSVLEEMSARRFRHMPVTTAGRLCGIVSIGDIVNHRLGMLEQEQAALREYISS